MTTRPSAALLLAAIAAAVAVRPSHAQGAGDGFLFKAPAASLTLRSGFNVASARSDVFSFVTDQLTLRRRDFNSFTYGGSLAIRVAPRYDVVADVAYAGTQRHSEFRDWVDQDDLPITQTTSFKRVPVTLSVRRYFAPDGRSIGRFAWIPAPRAAYVGVGAGWMWFRFRQVGDFVDFQTLNVFPDEFETSGWTRMVHAMAGVDFALTPFFSLNGEGRYTWAKGPMGRDYQDFNALDLSGLSLTAGLVVRM
jgi:opacity protein-like surface antigen